MHDKLSVGWNAWVAFASERLEALQLIRRCFNFMTNRKLARAFMSWLAVREAAARALRRREVISRALLHLMHRKLTAGWNSWVALVARRRKLLGLAPASGRKIRKRAIVVLIFHKD